MDYLTKRGVCLYLEKSPYTVTLKKYCLKLYFSSEFYKQKFLEMYPEELMSGTLKLQAKSPARIYADEYLLINLYAKIEKRGFCIELEGERITCLEKVLFAFVPKTGN